MDIIPKVDGFLLLQFALEKEGALVLNGGPWFINGQVLITWKWEHDIELRRDLLQSIPIWIRLILPTHLWSAKTMGRCVSIIGKRIFIDPATTTRSGAHFAWICVEVSANNGFSDRVLVQRDSEADVVQEWVQVAYEWKPLICLNCCPFGHSSSICPIHHPLSQQQPTTYLWNCLINQ